jgi:hypothetical protein
MTKNGLRQDAHGRWRLPARGTPPWTSDVQAQKPAKSEGRPIRSPSGFGRLLARTSLVREAGERRRIGTNSAAASAGSAGGAGARNFSLFATFQIALPLIDSRWRRRLVMHRARSASRLKPSLRVVRGSRKARRKACGGGGRRRHRLGVLVGAVSSHRMSVVRRMPALSRVSRESASYLVGEDDRRGGRPLSGTPPGALANVP